MAVNTGLARLRRLRRVLNAGHFANFTQNWLPWQRPLRYQKRGPDRSSATKMLSFREKIAKIGPADPECHYAK